MAKAKKAAPKKSSSKKMTVQQRIAQMEERIKMLESALTSTAELVEVTATITYEVKFFGGAGRIRFKGENLDRAEDGATTFNVEQSSRKQRVQVGGTAPEGSNGRIEVQVSQNGEVISPFSDNTFKSGVFVDQIFYTVK